MFEYKPRKFVGQTKILPGSEIEKILIQGYESGKSLKTLSDENKVSQSCIHRALKRAGVKTRPRGYKAYCNDGLTYSRRAYRKLSADPERYAKYREQDYLYTMKYRHGITSEEYYELRDAQDKKCAICESPPSEGKRLALDHCHDTGAIRGLLCDRCNSMIGFAKNSIDLLKAGIEYLLLPPFHPGKSLKQTDQS